MRLRQLLVAFALMFAARVGAAAVTQPKVVFIVIDGLRTLEWQGQARDDQGRRLTAEALVPGIMELKKRGLFLTGLRISNPYGISLPAYSDMFAGRRQETITSNTVAAGLSSQYPTIFEIVQDGLKLGPNGVAVHASWEPVCLVSARKAGTFYQSCGWKHGLGRKNYAGPEVYPGIRTDMDTFVEFTGALARHKPRLAFMQLAGPDEEGHLHETIKGKTGIDHGVAPYQRAVQLADYYVGRIWQQLQSDPFYKDQTTLIVTTDHGMDSDLAPATPLTHGYCVKKRGAKQACGGCSHVFGLIVGPGIKPAVLAREHTHADLAPTIARTFGLTMPSAKGQPIPEATAQ